MNRLTEDEKAGLFFGSVFIAIASGFYYTSILPNDRGINSLKQATPCTPCQVEAVYEKNRQAHGQSWRDAATRVGETLDSYGLGSMRSFVEGSAAWLSAPAAEGSPGSIQPIAVTGLAAPTAAAAAIVPQGGAAQAATTIDANLGGLVEAASSSVCHVAPPNTLRALDGSSQLLRVRHVHMLVETMPVITPMALFAFNNLSPVSIWGTALDVETRMQQTLCRTVAEEPWGLQDPRGNATVPVKHGSAVTVNDSVVGSFRGLRPAGEVKYRADNHFRHWPWLSYLVAGERILRIRDKGIHAGASLTVVGGLRRNVSGALELCAHPDFGFCIPQSLQELLDASRGAVLGRKVAAGAFAALGTVLIGAAMWDHRYFVQRFLQWAVGKRAARPQWGDVRCHRPPTDALALLRRMLQHHANGGDVDTLEVEPGVLARAELARAAGPGITAVEELSVADDEAMGEEEDPAMRCVVCLQRRRCIMCVPCRHVATCIECMVVHTLNRGAGLPQAPRCPICMTDLQWIQRVYL